MFKLQKKNYSQGSTFFWINTEAVYKDKNRENNIKRCLPVFTLSEHLVNPDNLLHMAKMTDLRDSVKSLLAMCISLEAVGISEAKLLEVFEPLVDSDTIAFNQLIFSICSG